MRVQLAAALILGAAGCIGDAVDQPAIPASEYQAWKKLETYGELPAHGGNGYRIIYANDAARSFEGGRYPEDSILVKEVHDLALVDGKPAAGTLQYVAIMRRLPGTPPMGLDDEGGWLFSETPTAGGTETHYAYCWESCHIAAPYHGAWFDYSRLDSK